MYGGNFFVRALQITRVPGKWKLRYRAIFNCSL